MSSQKAGSSQDAAARRARRRRRWLWGGACFVLFWLVLSNLVVRGIANGWLEDNYEGETSLGFVVLWPWLDVTAFGLELRAQVGERDQFLDASRVSIDVSLSGLFGGDPVSAVTVSGLRVEVAEGSDLSIFGKEEPEAPEPPPADGEEGGGLPLLRFEDLEVAVRSSSGLFQTILEAGEVELTEEGAVLQVRARSGELGGIDFDELSTSVRPREGEILVHDFEMESYGGDVEGFFKVDHRRAGRVNGELTWEKVRLGKVAEAFGWADAKKFRGKLRGKAGFRGSGFSLDALEGDGFMELAEGNFVSPISLAVFVLIKVPVPEPSIFHSGRLDFVFERCLFHVQKARAVGTSFDLTAKGLIAFSGGVDLEVGHGTTTVGVTGTINHPEATVLPANYLTRPFHRLLKSKVRRENACASDGVR